MPSKLLRRRYAAMQVNAASPFPQAVSDVPLSAFALFLSASRNRGCKRRPFAQQNVLHFRT
jgi:hypothetical protein